MKACLLGIDLQRGFIGESTSHIVKRIEVLLEQGLFEATVFTQFANEAESAFRRLLNWHLLSTPTEQEIAPELSRFEPLVFRKTTYGISGSRALDYLESEQFDAVFLAGIDTDGCVLKTALDLFDSNIRTFLLESYCASSGGVGFHEAAVKLLRRLIGPHHVISGPLDARRYQDLLSRMEADRHGPRRHL